jgi:hypothetical protein
MMSLANLPMRRSQSVRRSSSNDDSEREYSQEEQNLSNMPENPRLLSLGMNGIPERSVGHSPSWPKAPAFRPEIGLL